MNGAPPHRSTPAGTRGWLKRVAWLAALWLAGVVALAAIAAVIRLLMTLAGLTVPA